MDGEVVVDMVEKEIMDVDDGSGDGGVREKSLLWKGHHSIPTHRHLYKSYKT